MDSHTWSHEKGTMEVREEDKPFLGTEIYPAILAIRRDCARFMEDTRLMHHDLMEISDDFKCMKNSLAEIKAILERNPF